MKVLIVVDMQNDFIDGALGTAEAVGIVDGVADRIRAARAQGETVIFTRDTHSPNYLETQEGRNLPVTHCVRGTKGWEISPKLEVADSLIVDKPSFGSMELAEKVAGMEDVESIELVGLCTDICVISNALLLKARMPETPIMVDGSLCAGVTPASHENALNAMKMCQIMIQ